MNVLVTNLQRQGRNFFIVQGILALAAGLAVLLWPGPSLNVIALIFAAWIAADGIIAIINTSRHRAQYRAGLTPFPPTGFGVVRGGFQLLLALLIALAPTIFAAMLVFLVSAIALLVGIVNLGISYAAKSLGARNWWVFLIVAVVALVVGFLMIVYPRESIVSILWLLGAMAVVQGIAFLVFAFKLNVSVADGERRESYQRFDGVIEGEVVTDQRSDSRAVEGEIIDEDTDERR